MTVGRRGVSPIYIKDLSGLQTKIKQLEGKDPAAALRANRTASIGIGEMVADYMRVYPISDPAKRSATWKREGGFVSEKQKGWFFAALREGTIHIPYRRKASGGLQGKWYVRPTYSGAVVGNPVPYGIWVHHPKHQIAMHRDSGWRTLNLSTIMTKVFKRGGRQKLVDAVDKMLKDVGFGTK
jgi:hypothetical protein